MILAAQARVCHIIARPNEAWGKTTFALKYLPRVTPGTAFVNADLIAAGLSPLAPEQQLFTAGGCSCSVSGRRGGG
jgi:predicted ABC-type ATPase